jgi:activator of HSP90 ATPase
MSIHQEAAIKASPAQIYEFLTNGEIFTAATEMPAQVSDREGDRFSLFGGRVEGRQIELVPGERVVQAWRFGSAHPDTWEPGVYSIVRFTLQPESDGTRFVIDHDGIPPEWQDHIQTGYPTFYEGPLTRYFAE